MDTYDGCCGSCVHMNTNDFVGHKDHCYCTERRQYYDLHDRKCRYYEYDKFKDYYDLNHRWHIVSAIMGKLNLNDNYECVNLLHNFRKNFIENEEKYTHMLVLYDIIGPVIAKCLLEDDDSYELCKKLCRDFLIDIIFLIKEGHNDEALSKYEEMTNLLIRIYKDNIMEYMEKKKMKVKI